MKINLYTSALIILFSCQTSREYYNRGDYYTAVYKSVHRLKQYPNHRKSREVLQKAYPLFLQSLETKSQNLIASNGPFRYRNTFSIYAQINSMYELIHSSPAALEVIPEPKNYYKEIGEIRQKAAEETYDAGIESMMRGTRTDSRVAYQYFSEANAFVPHYKEVVEMLDKSEDEAMLRIVWRESGIGMWWSSTEVIWAIEALPFVELQHMNGYVQSDDPAKKNVALDLRITIEDYDESTPTITSSSQEIVDSVKVGEKKVKNVMVPVKEAIKGTYTEYKKTSESKGVVSITIREKKTGDLFFSREFTGRGQWTGTWSECKGDRRVFDSKHDCSSSEPYPNSASLREQAREQVQKDAIESLTKLLAHY